jgi:esterase/lipase superfamily enzyme
MPWAPRKFELSVRIAGSSDVAGSVDDQGLSRRDPHHILLLVHGYNNSHDAAETSYQLFVDNMRKAFGERTSSAPDTIAKFHWPGDESTMLGTTVGYPLDIRHARDAAQRLAIYLARLPVPGSGASRRITIVGHSMGCRLILEALGQVSATSVPSIAIVGLMAAASPVDFVRRNGRLFRTGNPPRRMVKFFSEQDLVLQVGFPLGQWLAFQWQIEDDNYVEAIGRFGHPDEFGSPQRTRNGHSDYWGDQKIVTFLVQQIDATTRTQLAAAETPSRGLQPASKLAARGLATRTAPFETA